MKIVASHAKLLQKSCAIRLTRTSLSSYGETSVLNQGRGRKNMPMQTQEPTTLNVKLVHFIALASDVRVVV